MSRAKRSCNHCLQPTPARKILWSSEFPEFVPTKKGGLRPGTVIDAERVYCSTVCAKAFYEQHAPLLVGA